jgi:hypothetical protein
VPTSPAQTSSSQSSSQEPPVQSTESADTRKTRNRYNDAVRFLREAIEVHGGEQWKALPLPELEDKPEDWHDSQLREQIDEAMKAVSIKDQGAWEKCRHIMQCIFTALSPLAKNFLTIASTGSNVYIHSRYFDDRLYRSQF